jgi:type I restriction enzyme S subunit
LPIPSLREQEAIANVLSNVDGLIEGLQKLIDKKRLMKQGAMQRLLNPYENGQLKEGWEVKKLGDIAQVGRGRVISHKEINLAVEGKYPVYSSQTSNNGVMGYIDSFDFDGEYITWTTDGVNAGKVFYRNGKFNRTNVCGTIKLLGENAVFVALMLGTITPKYVAKNLANPKLMNEPVKKIDIALPPLEEQEAIATTLSDMDTEIEALDKKLAKYRQIKQGMMQELLTGKTRLVEPNIVREASANAEDQTWGEQQLIKMNSYSATRHQC